MTEGQTFSTHTWEIEMLVSILQEEINNPGDWQNFISPQYLGFWEDWCCSHLGAAVGDQKWLAWEAQFEMEGKCFLFPKMAELWELTLEFSDFNSLMMTLILKSSRVIFLKAMYIQG